MVVAHPPRSVSADEVDLYLQARVDELRVAHLALGVALRLLVLRRRQVAQAPAGGGGAQPRGATRAARRRHGPVQRHLLRMRVIRLPRIRVLLPQRGRGRLAAVGRRVRLVRRVVEVLPADAAAEPRPAERLVRAADARHARRLAPHFTLEHHTNYSQTRHRQWEAPKPRIQCKASACSHHIPN